MVIIKSRFSISIVLAAVAHAFSSFTEGIRTFTSAVFSVVGALFAYCCPTMVRGDQVRLVDTVTPKFGLTQERVRAFGQQLLQVGYSINRPLPA